MASSPRKRKVEIELTALDRFTAPFRKLERNLVALGRSSGIVGFRNELERTGDAGARLLAKFRPLAIGAAALGVGAFALAASSLHSFVEQASHLDDATGRLGVTAEALQKITFAAGLAGASVEDTEKSLGLFNKTVGLAATGSKKQAALFRGLGINLRDGKRIKDTSELFVEYADRVSRIKDPQVQALRALQAFGKGGLAILPTLKLGAKGVRELMAELETFGAVIPTSAIKAGDDLGDNLDRLGRMAGGLRTVIGVELVGVIGPLVQGFVDWYKAGDNAARVQARVRVGVRQVVDAGIALVGWIRETGIPGVQAFAEAVGGWKHVGLGIAVAFGATLLAPLLSFVLALGSLGAATIGLGVQLGAFLWPAITAGLPVLGALLQIVRAISLALLANPWALAIVGIVAAATAVAIYWEPVKGFFADLWAGVTDAFGRALERIKTGWTDLVAWIGAKVEAIRGLMPNLAGRFFGPPAAAPGARPGALAPGASAPIFSAPVTGPTSSRAQVGGRVEIVLRDPTGRAKLEKIQSRNPDVPLDFDSGPLMTPAFGG